MKQEDDHQDRVLYFLNGHHHKRVKAYGYHRNLCKRSAQSSSAIVLVNRWNLTLSRNFSRYQQHLNYVKKVAWSSGCGSTFSYLVITILAPVHMRANAYGRHRNLCKWSAQSSTRIVLSQSIKPDDFSTNFSRWNNTRIVNMSMTRTLRL